MVACRQLPLGRARSISSTTRCSREPLRPEHVSRGCSATGDHARPQLRVRPYEPCDQPARTRRDLRDRARPRRPRAGREHLLEGTYCEVYPHIGRGRWRACAAVRASSRSPAASPATWRRRRRGRSTRAASSATRCLTPTAPRSTTPTCSSAAWSGTARPRPARSRPAGTRTSSSTPRTTARSCPILHLNGYKIANPTFLARIPRDELRSPPGGVRPRARLRGGRRPGRCTSRWPAPSTTRRRRDPRHPAEARASPAGSRPRWPMIVLRARRRAGPARRRSTGSPAEGTFRSHQVPIAEVRGNPSISQLLEEWLRSYRPEELFDEDRRAGRRAPRARPRGRPADGSQPACRTAALLLRELRAARLPRLRRRGATARRPAPASRRASWARSSPT